MEHQPIYEDYFERFNHPNNKKFFCENCNKETNFIFIKKMIKLHKYNYKNKKLLDFTYSIYKCSKCGFKWWGKE